MPVSAVSGVELFSLRSGVLGAVTQKFVNYRLRLAIVGDVPGYVARSDALRDYVREANRGRQIWFVASEDALAERIAARSGRAAPSN